MDEFRDFLRGNNFFARAVTFAMIPIFLKFSLSIVRWYGHGETLYSLKLFGGIGILVGAFVGHQLYYRWIFPEKHKPKKI